MLKSFEHSTILKNDGHFWIPHPQISLKHYANICENLVNLIWLCRGQRSVQGFPENNSIKNVSC